MAGSKISSRRDLSLLRYSFLENLESNPRFALEETGLLSNEDLKARLERMRFQLDACCKGLLEARRIDEEHLPKALHERVTFLHRSVQDFLEENNELKNTETVQKIKKDIADKVKDLDVLNLISHTFLAQIKSVEFGHREVDPLGDDLGDAVKAIHQVWSGTRCLDFEFLDALDTILQRPKCGVSPDFRDGHTTYQRGHSFVRKDIKIGDDWVRFIDVIGTFAFHGFGEFLTRSTNRENNLIYGRSVDYLLYFATRGFQNMKTSANVSDYLHLVELLLRKKANLNNVMFWDSYCSYTTWESFFYNIPFSKGNLEIDEGTDKMIQLFLEYEADPYIWVLSSDSDAITHWFHAKKGLIFHNDYLDRIPARPKEPKSLRNLIELQPPCNAKAILALLPSNSEYEHEWNCSLKVSRRRARKLQGFPSGFEKNSSVQLGSDTEEDVDQTSRPPDKYQDRYSSRHSDGDADGDGGSDGHSDGHSDEHSDGASDKDAGGDAGGNSDGSPHNLSDQSSEPLLKLRNDVQSISDRPSPNLYLEFEDDSQSASRPTPLESHPESEDCSKRELRVGMEQTAKLATDPRKEPEAAASLESKLDSQSLATLGPGQGWDMRTFRALMFHIAKNPLFSFVIGVLLAVILPKILGRAYA